MVGAGLVLVLAVIGGVAGYLVYTQRAAEDDLRRDFGHRAALAGEFTGSGLNASDARNREFAEEYFGGPESGLQAALEESLGDPGEVNLLLRPDGEVLAATPRSLRGEAGKRRAGVVAQRAMETGRIAFGDVDTSLDPVQTVAAVPYASKTGQRVFVISAPLDFVATLTEGNLSSVLEVPGGRAHVIDGHGVVLATTEDKSGIGKPLSDRALASALSGNVSGSVGADFFGTGSVSNSTWRVVFVVPDHALMDPIRSTARVTWQLFAAFVVAMALLVILAVTALSRSARLAHARLHDALTGLPNRALFLEKAGRAVGQRGRGSVLAALFIDLDGFKPVNDVHGHAAGDALLVAVAERLNAAMRRNDVVSRFGGDEFLVLCSELAEERDAMVIADRIQQLLAQPFDIGGQQVTIGSSIGVAVYDDEETGGPAALIHNADLAMYKAKQGGRGRVERYEPANA